MPKFYGPCKLCESNRLLNFAGLCKRCNRKEGSSEIILEALRKQEKTLEARKEMEKQKTDELEEKQALEEKSDETDELEEKQALEEKEEEKDSK